MIVALSLLSVAMIVGGLYAAFEGWDIVVLERGWALLISGSVAAASGALLLGVTAAVARLGAIRKELVQLGELMVHPDVPTAPMPAFDPPSMLSAGLLDGGGAPAGAPVSEGADNDREPMLPLFMRPAEEQGPSRPTLDRSLDQVRDHAKGREANDGLDQVREHAKDREADDERRVRDGEPRLRIPDYLVRARDEDERGPPADDDVRHPEGPGDPDQVFGEEAEPVRAPERTEEPETMPEAVPDKAERPPPTVIGSYNSGENRYVMYSDGSIEAETPKGAFRFASLDELKEFIADGGESRRDPAIS